MSKITRRSYKRKKIIMGASLFGAIGLVSTGFAAWVLSSPAIDNEQAKLNVGTVSDKNMQFDDVIIYKTGDENKVADNNYSFNPREGDNTGRVRWGSVGTDDKPESLTLTVEGKVLNAQNVDDFTAIIAQSAEVDAAITAGYIVAPESYKTLTTVWDGGVAGSAQSTLFSASFTGDTEKTMSFTYEVKFTWGAFFEGLNPSEYFDTAAGLTAYPEIGTQDDTIDDDTVAGVLNHLYTTLNNVTLNLTLTANPN